MTADNDIVSKSNEFFSTDMAASSSPSPSSASPIQNSAARIEKYLATATSVYKSSRTHPRYHARIYSLSAIAAGILLNFLSFIAALFERYENAPIVVVVWVGFVYALSTCYQILDLVCSPSRSTEVDQQQQWSEFFSMHFPAPFVALVDTLGFLGFLALLIANTIVVSHLSGPNPIYIFNSIPWVICGLYHGSVAIQAIPSIFAQSSGRQRDYCCIDCKRESERRHGKSAAGFDAEATTTLLQNVDGSQNV